MKRKACCIITALLLAPMLVSCNNEQSRDNQSDQSENMSYIKVSEEEVINKGDDDGEGKSIYKYDSEGRLVKAEHFYNDELFSYDEYEYDSDGHTVVAYNRQFTIPEQEHKTVTRWSDIGGLSRTTSFEITHQNFYENSSYRQVSICDYNDIGLLIRTSSDDQVIEYEIKKDGAGSNKWVAHGSTQNDVIKYELYDNNEYKTISYYDSDGQLDMVDEHYKNGMLKRKCTYSDGKIDWYVEKNDKGATIAEMRGDLDVRYDNRGVMAEIKDNMGGFDNRKYSMISENKDDVGNVIEQVFKISNDEGEVWEVTEKYKWKKLDH